MFKSIDDIVRVFSEQGSNWFRDDIMSHWGTILHDEIFEGRIFLTKDTVADLYSKRKKWSVREVYLASNGDYSIRTHGLACYTKRQAMSKVKSLL